MHIPKIIFKYAYPFDQTRRKLFQEKQLGDYPSVDEVKNKVGEYRDTWLNYNQYDKIIKRIIELLGVTYPRDIEAYVFGTGLFPMSIPLLIPMKGKGGEYTSEKFIEILIHELAHIFAASVQENPELGQYWKEVREQYRDESISVQNHLIVYAVAEILLAEIFGEEKMRELIKMEDSDYQRAIALVDELGPEVLIADFRRFAIK